MIIETNRCAAVGRDPVSNLCGNIHHLTVDRKRALLHRQSQTDDDDEEKEEEI